MDIQVKGMKMAGARLLCCLPLALAACDSARDAPETVRSDSAGIPVATALEPLWELGEGWTLSEEPELSIGAVTGAKEYLLDGVWGAVRLGDGGIVLGEWNSGEVRRYDRRGTFVWRAGGRGEGPGEHARLFFVGALAGDSVVTYDPGRRQVHLFAPGGEVARTLGFESPWPEFRQRSVIGVSGRRLGMTFYDVRRNEGEGVVRSPTIRIAALSLDDGAVAEVLDAPGPEMRIARGESRGLGYRFGKGPRFAVMAGRLALVDTEIFSIRSISLDDGSTTRILRRDEPLREVTSDDVEAYVEWMEDWLTDAGLPEEVVEAQKPGWRKSPRAPTLPVLESIHLDAVGNLWVVPHAPHGAGVSAIDVYTPDGVWLGGVAIPPGLDLESAEIGDDYLLGVWRDEREVEYVRMYGLEK